MASNSLDPVYIDYIEKAYILIYDRTISSLRQILYFFNTQVECTINRSLNASNSMQKTKLFVAIGAKFE